MGSLFASNAELTSLRATFVAGGRMIKTVFAGKSRNHRKILKLGLSLLATGTAIVSVSLAFSTPSLAQQYWDGFNTTSNNIVDGGSGTWDASTTNWTNSGGTSNIAYAPGTTIIFSEFGGNVIVSGTQTIGNIEFQNTGYLLTGDALAIQDAGTAIYIDSGDTAEINNSLANAGPGTGSLEKTGTGTLLLTGNSSYSGLTTVSAGVLEIKSGGVLSGAGGIVVSSSAEIETDGGGLGTGQAVTVSAGGTLDLNGAEQIASLSGGGVVDFSANLTLNQSSASAFDGEFAGSGTLIKMGTAVFSFGGTANHTGGTDIDAGTFTVTSSGSLGNADVASGATLNVNASGSAGAVANGGTFTNNGTAASLTNTSGSTTNSGTITGTTSVSGGTVGNSGTMSGLVTATGGILTNTGGISALSVNGGTVTNSGSGNVAGTTGLSSGSINNSNTLTGVVTVSGGAFTTTGTLSGGLTASGGSVDAQGNLFGTISNSVSFDLTGNAAGDGQFDNNVAGSVDLAGFSLSGFTGFANSGWTDFADGSGISVSGTVSSSGTMNFVGTNTINATLFDVTGGSLDMDNGAIGDSLTVTGNFELDSGATWTVNVNHLEQNDSMIVNGTVTLGGVLSVEALPPEASYEGAPTSLVYGLIANDSTDAVTGTFSNVTTNYAFLVPTVDYAAGDGNDVVLTLENLSAAPDFVPFAETDNQLQTAMALADFDYSSPDGADVLAAINMLTNAEVAGVIDQIGGTSHLSSFHLGSIAFGSFVSGLSRRTRHEGDTDDMAALLTAYAGDGSGGNSELGSVGGPRFWMSGLVDYANVESDGNGPEVAAILGGGVLGVEQDAGDALLGAALGYARSEFESGSVSGKTTADSIQIGVYGAWGATEPLAQGAALSGAVGYARSFNDSSRDVTIATLTREATASYETDNLGGEIVASYGLSGSDTGRWSFSPYAGVNYTHTRNGAFTETGAGTLNLSSSANTREQLKGLLGIELEGMVETEDYVLYPRASVGLRHEFLDTNVTGSFALAGSPTPFSVSSANEARSEAITSLGMDVGFGSNTWLQLGADAGFSEDAIRLGANAAFTTAF